MEKFHLLMFHLPAVCIRESAGIFRTERFFIIHSLLGDHIETRFYIKIILYVRIYILQ